MANQAQIVWNSNAAMIEPHERESIERGDAARCKAGDLYLDETNQLWCDTAEGRRLVGRLEEPQAEPGDDA